MAKVRASTWHCLDHIFQIVSLGFPLPLTSRYHFVSYEEKESTPFQNIAGRYSSSRDRLNCKAGSLDLFRGELNGLKGGEEPVPRGHVWLLSLFLFLNEVGQEEFLELLLFHGTKETNWEQGKVLEFSPAVCKPEGDLFNLIFLDTGLTL